MFKNKIAWSQFESLVIQSQDYYFELFVDKNNKPIFSAKHRLKCSTNKVANIEVGQTFLTVDEITKIGEQLIENKFSTYNLIFNNCQHFANELVNKITNNGKYNTVINTKQQKFFSRIHDLLSMYDKKMVYFRF